MDPEIQFQSQPNKQQHFFEEDKNENILYKQKLNDYNFIQIPPNFEEAEKHAFARRATAPLNLQPFDSNNMESSGAKVHRECPCCSYNIDRKELSLFCDTYDLRFLGSGFPLFYNYIIWCIYLCLAYLFVCGGQELYSNYQGNYCQAGGETYQPEACRNSLFNLLSIANKKHDDQAIEFSNDLNTIMLVVLMIMMLLFRRSQNKLTEDIDKDLVTPSDYTVHVSNIPLHQKELKDLFRKNGYNPVDITLVYDSGYVSTLQKNLDSTLEKYQELLGNYGLNNLHDPKRPIEIKDSQIEIKQNLMRQGLLIREIIRNPEFFSGQAFISFDTEQDKARCIENNPLGFCDQIKYFKNELQKPITDSSRSPNEIYWNDNKLVIQEAWEPQDVNWEGIHTSEKDRFIGKIKGYIIGMGIIILCGAAVLALSVYQMYHLDDVAENGDITPQESLQIQLLSVGVSCLINGLNMGVQMVLPYIVSLESPDSRSQYNASYAVKFSFLSFVNSALLTLLITVYFTKNYYGRGGFIYTQTIVFLQNIIMTPMMNVLNTDWIQKRYEIRTLKKEVEEGQCTLTQQQLNQALEENQYNQAERYSDILNTMWLTFFYAPCIPLGIICTIVNLILVYWTDKLNLVKMCSVKEHLSHKVSQEMIELMEYIIILYCIGNYVFEMQITGYHDTQSLVMLGIGLIYTFAPMQWVSDKLFSSKDNNETMTYTEAVAYNKFEIDYNQANPLHSQFIKAYQAYQKYKEFQNDEINAFEELEVYKKSQI
ncbi:hypothetical protein PPERSA_00673 [Pseudocohnilembus persalinus]|uniref:Uncharacterized protein n=1 Tax=Pseudocohnilembus persalinus TaxID=266149 RepID=A0A0V0QSW6_PSEPJ|nr:hypothetical protein PPERSA_00673 [Pseudocohnilembus persalinus]|eukprot:KRX05372.1 hypothetical protein PPERSA_00673 [Pseudocohnilembus persalinus]